MECSAIEKWKLQKCPKNRSRKILGGTSEKCQTVRSILVILGFCGESGALELGDLADAFFGDLLF